MKDWTRLYRCKNCKRLEEDHFYFEHDMRRRDETIDKAGTKFCRVGWLSYPDSGRPKYTQMTPMELSVWIEGKYAYKRRKAQ